MNHLVLIGDSILDNAAYTAGGPAVIDHLRAFLPDGWKASLCAVDGSTTDHIGEQLTSLPEDFTHLVLSVGGNNALLRADVLEMPVASSGDALLMLSGIALEFEGSYRTVVSSCLQLGRPVVLCTIYHGNFPDPSYQSRASIALTVFNDVIIRVALDSRLKVIDLRLLCNSAEDYANPIEPSAIGGAKIAQAIVRAVTEPPLEIRGAYVVAG